MRLDNASYQVGAIDLNALALPYLPPECIMVRT
jgi:hypothetical protein